MDETPAADRTRSEALQQAGVLISCLRQSTPYMECVCRSMYVYSKDERFVKLMADEVRIGFMLRGANNQQP